MEGGRNERRNDGRMERRKESKKEREKEGKKEGIKERWKKKKGKKERLRKGTKKFLPPQAPRENDEVIRRENKTRLCFLIKKRGSLSFDLVSFQKLQTDKNINCTFKIKA